MRKRQFFTFKIWSIQMIARIKIQCHLDRISLSFRYILTHLFIQTLKSPEEFIFWSPRKTRCKLPAPSHRKSLITFPCLPQRANIDVSFSNSSGQKKKWPALISDSLYLDNYNIHLQKHIHILCLWHMKYINRNWLANKF